MTGKAEGKISTIQTGMVINRIMEVAKKYLIHKIILSV